MDLRNHAVKKEVSLAEVKKEVKSQDLTRTAIAEGYQVNIYEVPMECGPIAAINLLGTEQAASFTTKEFIGRGEIKPTALGDSHESILFASDFIRKLTATYINSPHTVPCENRAGFKEGLQRLLTVADNRDGTFGENAIPQNDITNVLDSFDENDIIEDTDGWYGLRHFIYLPITNRDINIDIATFDSFAPNDQTAIRTARMCSLSKTYITILLKDGTQFVMWPSETQLGIVAAYPKGQ